MTTPPGPAVTVAFAVAGELGGELEPAISPDAETNSALTLVSPPTGLRLAWGELSLLNPPLIEPEADSVLTSGSDPLAETATPHGEWDWWAIPARRDTDLPSRK